MRALHVVVLLLFGACLLVLGVLFGLAWNHESEPVGRGRTLESSGMGESGGARTPSPSDLPTTLPSPRGAEALEDGVRPEEDETSFRIEGRVVDEGGAPVAGARISASRVQPDSVAEPPEGLEFGRIVARTQCDVEGRFSLPVPEARYLFQIHAQSGAARSDFSHAHAGDRGLHLVVPSLVTLEGLVRDEHGVPCPKVHVQLSFENGSASMRVTDEEGRFSAEVARTTLRSAQAIVPPHHYGPVQEVLVPQGADTHTIELLLPGEMVIRGACVDDQDAPVAGVVVEALPEGRRGGFKPRATTDASGAFLLEGLDGRRAYALRVQGDYHCLDDSDELHSVGSDGILLRVARRLEVRGRVVTQVPDAPLDVVTVSLGQIDRERSVLRRVSCNEAGEFHLSGLVPGRYVLQASGGAFAEHRGTVLDLRESRTDLELQLEPGGAIAGRVVNGRGEGVVGAIVEAWSEEAGAAQAESVSRGSFELEGLSLGVVYQVTARMPGVQRDESAAVAARAGDQLTLTVSGVPTISGVLKAPAHVPVAVAKAEVHDAAGEVLSRHGVGVNEGRFSFPLHGYEEAVSIVIYAKHLAPLRVFLPPGVQGNYDLGEIVLHEGGVLTGVVLSEEGDAIAGATVEGQTGDGFAVTSESGDFSLDNVSEAVGALRVSATGFQSQRVPLGTGLPPATLRVVLARE